MSIYFTVTFIILCMQCFPTPVDCDDKTGTTTGPVTVGVRFGKLKSMAFSAGGAAMSFASSVIVDVKNNRKVQKITGTVSQMETVKSLGSGLTRVKSFVTEQAASLQKSDGEKAKVVKDANGLTTAKKSEENGSFHKSNVGGKVRIATRGIAGSTHEGNNGNKESNKLQKHEEKNPAPKSKVDETASKASHEEAAEKKKADKDKASESVHEGNAGKKAPVASRGIAEKEPKTHGEEDGTNKVEKHEGRRPDHKSNVGENASKASREVAEKKKADEHKTSESVHQSKVDEKPLKTTKEGVDKKSPLPSKGDDRIKADEPKENGPNQHGSPSKPEGNAIEGKDPVKDTKQNKRHEEPKSTQKPNEVGAVQQSKSEEASKAKTSETTAEVRTVKAVETTSEVRPIKAAETTAEVRPIKAAETTAEVKPIKAAETTAEVRPIKAAETTAEVRPIKVAETTAEVRPIKAAETTAGVRPIKAAETTAEVRPIKAAGTTAEVRPIKTAETTAEVKPIKAAETTAGVSTTKAPETPKTK